MKYTELQKKTVTKEHLEKRPGVRNRAVGFKYSWRMMEAATQDRTGCSKVVSGLCATGSDKI